MLLSRSTIERLIQELDLYPEDRRLKPLEEIVAAMRRRITVSLDQGEVFRISYESDDPEVAQKVTARLASLLNEENARDRQGLATDTSAFLEEELKTAEGRLVEQERSLARFRREHAGELPDQMPSIMQAIQNRQLQQQSLTESLARDRSERLLVERQRADLAATTVVDPVPAAGVSAAALDTLPASVQLDAARAELERLELSRTPKHPDVRAARRKVESLKVRAKEEAEARVRAAESRADKPPALSAAEVNRANRASELEAQILNLERQIAAKEDMQKRLEGEIHTYQSKAETVPLRESQLAALTRGYETLQQTYQALLRKKQDSEMAANLERRRAGEQFSIVDPAGLPERPYWPNRLQIIAIGLAAGLGLGACLAFLLEYRDTTMRTETDVVAALDLPLVALIPDMQSSAERARARRARVRVELAAVVIAVGAAGAAAFVFLVL
jgi:polysaccharide chain length determinant protein (PEP-CTERM system associated)